MRAGRVARVVSGDDAEERRHVARRSRERTDLIERGSERDQAVARHAAVGRLQTEHAAERRRLADRSAGLGAERERHHAGGDRDGRSAARSAGNPIVIPRVARRPERGMLGRRAHRELVAVGLADDHRAGAARDARRRRPSRVARNARAGATPAVVRIAGGADVVLERDGDAEQRRVRGRARDRAAAARASAPRSFTCRKACRSAVEPADAVERVAAHLDGRDARAPRRRRGFRRRVRGSAHEPSTRGTLKSPAARSAAGAWPSSRSRDRASGPARRRDRRRSRRHDRRGGDDARRVDLLDLVGVGRGWP